MLQSRIFGVIWLIFSLVFFIFDDSYLGILLLILTGILLILLILNIVLLKNKLVFNLKTEGTVHKNEPGRLAIQVENKSVIPVSKVKIYLEFENKLTDQLDKKVFVLSLKSRDSELLPLDMRSKYCGQIQVTVKRIHFYDFLGIFTRNVDVNTSSELFILPNLYPINITVGDSDVGLADSHSHKVSRQGDDGLEIFGIKSYSHEDNLKHIHWNLTSKFDELIIKELSEAVNYTFLILIDLTVKNDTNKNDPAVTDAMMDTFISITESLLDEGYESSIGWLDKESNIIQIEEVYSKDQLTILLKQILQLEQRERKETLLETFSQSDSRDQYSHLVYLTSEQGHERARNDLVQTKVTELLCQSEKKVQKMSKELIYTPETMNEDLGELSI